MKIHAISHTKGKNNTPRISHVKVKPPTRVAIASGRK